MLIRKNVFMTKQMLERNWVNSKHCYNICRNEIHIFITIGLIFEIVEGGWMDIDIKITGPDGKVIYHGEGESTGKYTFAAYESGIYHYCFSNKMSSMTPKVIIALKKILKSFNVL